MLIGGCDALLDGLGDDEPDEENGDTNGTETPPTETREDVAKLLEGFLDHWVDPLIRLYGYQVNEAPSGDSDHSWDIVFDDYRPPGEEFTVDGTMELRITDGPPTVVEAETDGELELSGHPDHDTVAMVITAEWDAGFDFEGGEPDSVEGSFTIDGHEYDFQDVLDALDGNGDGELPGSVVELAGGVFQVVELVLERYYVMPQYGMTITVDDSGDEWTVTQTLDGFTVPGRAIETSGETQVTVRQGPPSTVEVSTPQPYVDSKDGETVLTAELELTAEWESWEAFMDGPPDSMTGTFTVDGTAWDIEELLKEDTPEEAQGLPEEFRTPAGDFAQSFCDRVWRPATEDPGAPWANYQYMRFDIGPDGLTHETFTEGTREGTGPVMWTPDDSGEGVAELAFPRADGEFHFTVLNYSEAHLHLRTPWGDAGTREWLFSSGIDNLSGVVLDGATYEPVDHYAYFDPIPGAQVELHFADGEQGETFLKSVETDARGYFEFTRLSEIDDAIFDNDLILMVDGYDQEHWVWDWGHREWGPEEGRARLSQDSHAFQHVTVEEP